MSGKNKFVTKLSSSEEGSLKKGYKTGKSFIFRRKCHAILLSNEGQTVNELSIFFGVSAISVYGWLKAWESQGLKGLERKAGQGRPRKLSLDNEQHVKTVKTLVENEPQNLNRVLSQLQSELELEVSKKTLQRFLKNLNTDGSASEKG
ncbi:MAG: helix-turn-helix domain-containing protein [Bacteroidota bacterium]